MIKMSRLHDVKTGTEKKHSCRTKDAGSTTWVLNQKKGKNK